MHAITVGCIGLSTAVKTAFDLACPLRAMTGWNCPLCGGTRAVLALVHGRWQEAAHDNLLVVLGPLVALVVAAGWALARRSGRVLSWPPRSAAMVALGLLVWTVLRNLPAFEWLSPLEGG